MSFRKDALVQTQPNSKKLERQFHSNTKKQGDNGLTTKSTSGKNTIAKLASDVEVWLAIVAQVVTRLIHKQDKQSEKTNGR